MTRPLTTSEAAEAAEGTTMIQPKYDIGDKVWGARASYTSINVECPDCKGGCWWVATTPAGESFDIECPTCRYGYEVRGTVVEWHHRASATLLTVGSIRVDTHDTDRPVSYMMIETGIGSGTIHYEESLFGSELAAMAFAESKSREMSSEQQSRELSQQKKRKKESRNKPSYEQRRIRELEKRVKELEAAA